MKRRLRLVSHLKYWRSTYILICLNFILGGVAVAALLWASFNLGKHYLVAWTIFKVLGF